MSFINWVREKIKGLWRFSALEKDYDGKRTLRNCKWKRIDTSIYWKSSLRKIKYV